MKALIKTCLLEQLSANITIQPWKKSLHEITPQDIIELNALYNQPVLNDAVFTNALTYYLNVYEHRMFSAYDNDQLVGFILVGKTTLKKEAELFRRLMGISVKTPVDPQEPLTDVILMVAVKPSYRGRGLFTKLLDAAHLHLPYYVHLNTVFSPMDIWSKQGCAIVTKLDITNSLGKCGGKQYLQALDEMLLPGLLL